VRVVWEKFFCSVLCELNLREIQFRSIEVKVNFEQSLERSDEREKKSKSEIKAKLGRKKIIIG